MSQRRQMFDTSYRYTEGEIKKREGKIMKKMLFVLVVLGLFALTACSEDGYYRDEQEYEPGTEYVKTEGETYAEIIENPFINTSDMPVSTFSTDVDTASYSNVRRMLNDGYLPQANAVRIEEMINYFNYDIAGPSEGEVIKISTELSQAPWNTNHQLLMIALKTEEVHYENTDGMNLVFLIDVSGSMYTADKLPLLKNALYLLIEQLRPVDRISIVVYAGAARIVLEGGDSTEKEAITNAIDSLQSGGSTAGGAGIELAYEVAARNFIENGNNRIILATDGDFNIGMSSTSAMIELIAEKRETGVFLSVLGFGTGNIRDDIMESLADNGNGVYYYIDSMEEAEKVFVNELGSSMITVAKDVKLQIEFNPMHVKGYRLIGYENRVLSNTDFEDDTKDAGDMGSGDVVIAFYEIIPADSEETIETKEFELPTELRYTGENFADEFVTVSIRYKDPIEDTSLLIQRHAYRSDYTENPSESFRFASSVVEFGLLLRNSDYQYDSSFSQIISRAADALGEDQHGYREEFISLVELAQTIKQQD
jgi:Ca-activated chloride channel homolog